MQLCCKPSWRTQKKMATIGPPGFPEWLTRSNNPLAAILGFTDLLLENPQVPEKRARKICKSSCKKTQRTKDIVQDLLSFARQRPVQRELVQVNNVLRQTIKLRKLRFRQSRSRSR